MNKAKQARQEVLEYAEKHGVSFSQAQKALGYDKYGRK
jgi:hypothetical protein